MPLQWARDELVHRLGQYPELGCYPDVAALDGDEDTILVAILEQVQTLLQAEGVLLVAFGLGEGEGVVTVAHGCWEAMRGYCGQRWGAFHLVLPVIPCTIACVPLISHGVRVGRLYVRPRRRLEAAEMRLLVAMGDIAANALARRQRISEEQQMLYDITLEGWVQALSLRDNETEAHTRRVTALTLEVARAMGFAEELLVHVRRGALLHDIGKLAIPDSILRKPGALNDAEWEVMRQHPGYAYDLLAPIAFLRPALDIPLYHHEKWDGTGYPSGLQGEDIPLAARIFAVVDVWDALRSDRPYRAAWPKERVRQHIVSLSGTHFDPAVVAVFLRALGEKPALFAHTLRPEHQPYANCQSVGQSAVV